VGLVASVVHRVREVFSVREVFNVTLDGICPTQCRDCWQCFDPVTTLVVNP